jgi:hypothetical protein
MVHTKRYYMLHTVSNTVFKYTGRNEAVGCIFYQGSTETIACTNKIKGLHVDWPAKSVFGSGARLRQNRGGQE